MEKLFKTFKTKGGQHAGRRAGFLGKTENHIKNIPVIHCLTGINDQLAGLP
jgi:hypothetical protein